MFRYIIGRILRSIVSIIIVMAIVMVLIFSLMNRQAVFQTDATYSKLKNNQKVLYEHNKYQEFGYLTYTTFAVYMNEQISQGLVEGITDPNSSEAAQVKKLPYSSKDYESASNWKYISQFMDYYKENGYAIKPLEGKSGDASKQPNLLAVKEVNIIVRVWEFFTNLIVIDTPFSVKTDADINRGYYITLSDPVSGLPALMGSGTKHQYLIYMDGKFPFIHQNMISINIGKSYSTYSGSSIADVILASQGELSIKETKFPTGVIQNSSLNLHSAEWSNAVPTAEQVTLFGNTQYVTCSPYQKGNSMVGYSFTIGIISTILVYLLGVPLGVLMARKKDKFADQLGMIYIVFIMAVPSLAYIFMFSAIGSSIGLPTKFGLKSDPAWLIYVLPVISLALPSIAGIMKWIRRYMIDQMNSDYVKFARAEGLSENEIFMKHILRNAAIPIVHGIPGSILGCLTGAIITEKVYAVPGTGKLLTTALNKSDNGMILGLTFFYTGLSITALLLGDILLAQIDPRISFSTSGGRK